jgi:geranylgeranyl pyrophosphate synthase
MIRALIKSKGIQPGQIAEYKQLYKDLGVIDDAKKEIKRYTNLALRSVKVLKHSEDREIFNWLAESLIKRIK